MAGVQVLYFAWLRERAGRSEEHVALPPGVATVGALVAHLAGLDDAHRAAFAHASLVRAAVNQEFAAYDAPIVDGDEVAFFPPVTGG